MYQEIQEDLADAISIHLSFDRFAQRFESANGASSSRELVYQVSTEFDQVAALTVQDEHIGLDQGGIQQIVHQRFQTTDGAFQVKQANVHDVRRIGVCKLSMKQLHLAFQTAQWWMKFV